MPRAKGKKYMPDYLKTDLDRLAYVLPAPKLKVYECQAKIVSPVRMSTQASSEEEATRLFKSKQARILDSGPDEVFVQSVTEVEG